MNEEVTFRVDPGICGFFCEVRAIKRSKHEVEIELLNSSCKHINDLAEELHTLSIRDLFEPVYKNKVFLLASKCRCHVSCVVPLAVIKASEVVLGLALPEDVFIKKVRGERHE